jgi:regulatory protein
MTQQEHVAPVTYLFRRAGAKEIPSESRDASADEAVLRRETDEVLEDAPAASGDTKSKRPENVAMHALTRRGMSVAEMTKLLEAREIEPDEVEAEIARLEGVGLLDDSALAENLVRTLQDRKGLGRQAISAELRRRKVDQASIEEALDSIDTDDELQRAIEVATKRAGQLSSYDQATAKRRLGAYLQRRGYSGSIFSQAMEAALSPRSSGGVQFR